MAPPSDLTQIGLDGFGLIDTFFNKRVFPARQGRWVVQVPYDEMEDPPINSRDAAAHFGGVMIVDYPKGKPQPRFASKYARKL